MKKISLLVILVFLMAALAISASAATQEHPHAGDHCVCGGSAVGIADHQCDDITWKPFPTNVKDFSNLPDGNYYLTQDLTITGNTSFSGKKLTICLNGYNINTTASSVFGYVKKGSVLNICDCSGKKDTQGNWTWNGTITANRTGTARDYGGVFNLNANTTANIYGGNFVGASGGKASSGGIFNICNDGHGGATGDQYLDKFDTNLTIYNGNFIGGDVSSKGSAINTWHYVNLYIYGGVISGGTSSTRGLLAIADQTRAYISPNAVIKNSAPSTVFVMEGNKLIATKTTLKDGVNAVKAGQYLRLSGNINEALTLDHVVIDLAGNTLRGVTITENTLVFDSATDGYTTTHAGKLIPAAGTPAKNYKTDGKNYLVIPEEEGYSFHRYYLAINKISLKPTTVGIGYKATFIGSDYIKSQLSTTTAYGYRLWLKEGAKITRGYPAEKFGGQQELTLRIDNFLSANVSAEDNAARAIQPVYGCAYLRLADGTTIESPTVCYTFRDMLEKADNQYEKLNQAQQKALETLSATFSGSMISWDISHIHHSDGGIWTPVTNSSFVSLLKSNSNKLPSGNYVLTEDVDIGTRVIRVDDGKTINLCLNGHTLRNSTRIFNNHGNLNICDCHAPEKEGYLISSYGKNDDAEENEFTLIYCFYNSVTNFYGGNLRCENPLWFAGLVAVSHDGSKSNPDAPAAVFNMYGGTIAEGQVIKGGGNITLWNGGVFNMYGGSVYGGTAEYGGNFNITNGCTLNVYGGTITGGVATGAKGGGNIYGYGVNIYGGTISDGTAVNGGNIYATEAINLRGGTISGGQVSPTVIDGVTTPATGLGGGIYATKGGNISGDLHFEGNTGADIYVTATNQLTATNLSATTKIKYDAPIRGALDADASLADRFTTTLENTTVTALNGKVALVPNGIDPAAVTKQDSTFRVGYSMADITPQEEGLVLSSFGNPNGRLSQGLNYRPYATTVAVTDQQNNTFLMVTLDLQSPPPEAVLPTIYKRISQATGVPEDQIYLSATHTHNVPSTSSSSAGNLRYRYLVIDAIITGAMEAMADRAPATMKTGSFDTIKMNWSRHYYYYKNNDTSTEKIYFGDQYGQAPQNGETFYHVRNGDTTMHMISFERTDKDPVLVVNWRAHPHRSGGKTKYTVDADVIGATREYIHSNSDYKFAYFQGAAGNMNTTSRISGETYKSGTITEYGNELGRQILNGLVKMKPAETGLIQTKKIVYDAPVDHSQDDKIEQAKALEDFYKNHPDEMDTYEEQIAKAAEYGFTSVFHASRLITKYNLGETRKMELNIFSIGTSVGFYTAPAELWDSFSEEMETLSPFDMTFCLGYCNGGVAYIPYKLDYYVSYEYFYCLFPQDQVINQMQAYYLEYLNEQYAS